MLNFGCQAPADDAETSAELPFDKVPEAPGAERVHFNSDILPDAPEEPEEAAPVRKVPMPGRRVPHKLHLKHEDDAFGAEEKAKVSRTLKEARENAGMTIEAVAADTKISLIYLRALEEGNFDELPQAVFVLAYLRRLCALYGLDASAEEHLVTPWLNLQCEIPDNLPQTVYPDGESENSRVMHRIEIALFAGAAIVVIGLVVFGIILLASHFGGKSRRVPAVDETQVLALQTMPELIAPAAPRVVNAPRKRN